MNNRRTANGHGNGNGEVAPDLGSFPNWTFRQIVTATLVALGVVLAFVLLIRFYMVVFVFFVAVALEVATRPAVVWLTRRGLRTWMAVLLVYLVLIALFFVVINLVVDLLYYAVDPRLRIDGTRARPQ